VLEVGAHPIRAQRTLGQLAQLVRNCIALGSWQAAAALAERRLAALPDDAEARAQLELARANAARGPTVGRNDPCPCGSGKRYKQCHGAFASATVASAAARDAAALVSRALAAHQQGALADAERDYRAALRMQPDHPVAMHYLGVLAYQGGDLSTALPLLQRSTATTSHEAEFHNNYGLALAAADRTDDAIAEYRRAVALRPEHAAAWSNNVDLPIPGSPPIRVADPSTNPPPSARSSSAIPVTRRSGSVTSASSPISAIARPPDCRLCLAWNGVTLPPTSSTNVFHSLQSTHCPCHRVATDPQA